LTTFSDLGLSAPILRAVQADGYTVPTPIQSKAIPIIMGGRDLLGVAQTGTGKTAAFALPIISRLAADRRPAMRKGCRVLVLAPTRELATQIAESFRRYGRHLDLTVAVVFGGVSHRAQITTMARGVDVLVATPGRLLDHVGERNINLSGTEILVLDEADQMLDLGFLPPIRRIVSQLSSKRQNLFFSATMPREIGKLADDLLRNPERVAVTPVASTVDRVVQRVLHVDSDNKRTVLVELFADPQMSRTLVFTRTKRGADKLARHLDASGIRVATIHGNKSQSQREQALAAFRAAKIRVLIATDIAARGIDIDQVTHVVNYEMPDTPESYVHRIGRTARAGAEGIAISLCATDERGQLRDIERLIRQSIPAEDRRHGGSGRAERPAARGASGGPRDYNGSAGPREDRRAHSGGRSQPAPRRPARGRQQYSSGRGFGSGTAPGRKQSRPENRPGEDIWEHAGS
jgi:ATP-dependent RNA helicase RhlE